MWDFSASGAQLGGSSTGGSFSTTTETIAGVEKTVLTSGTFYEVGTSILYDAIKAAYDGKGILTFNALLNWSGTDSVDSILHIGKKETGVTLGVTQSGTLTFARGNGYNADKSSQVLTAGTWQTVSFSLKKDGETTISLDGVSVAGTVLNWSGTGDGKGMNWDSVEAEREKYSIGIGAPGWSSLYPLTNTKVADLGFSYIAIPEPSVFGLLAGLGALALAGTRRRRRKA